MNIIEKSLEIALKAYSGKQDKAGKTYILHPLRVMAKMDTEYEMAVALLHDVIEDSDYTADDLLTQGIPPDVVNAVQLLSKVAGETYDQFIGRIIDNPIAIKVKMADIEDNINILRLEVVEVKDLQRVAKYHAAWKRLQIHS
ncbi:GTP pyrophosphokinase [Shewanella livingstonensis]|uniref:GTP pyrophosphokinase n=1 Tax=Shewanella livingstonensis TaxID=150120 RepID=A0A3G8LPV9_9GAMM|nr:GTP pyrophosphokinase [Shewanella livingstonensis]AZG71549.1 GTP pyrophosphokinase [Shewanella livingstonensis]